MKKIGILGSGVVAQTLGTGFVKHGYNVMMGTRDPSKLSEWNSTSGKGAGIGSFNEAAVFGELLVLAVAGRHTKNALSLAGGDNLSGKTIIDASNPISESEPENGVLNFFTNINRSLMEDLQDEHPEAHFVKAFNSVGSAFMVDPVFPSTPTMFICGNNGQAKEEVATILKYFSWDPEDMGGVEAARAIEPLSMLWCIPGFRENRWSHAFKLMKTR